MKDTTNFILTIIAVFIFGVCIGLMINLPSPPQETTEQKVQRYYFDCVKKQNANGRDISECDKIKAPINTNG